MPNRQIHLMALARARTIINVENLTTIIYGDEDIVRRKREAWARVEAVLGTADSSSLPSQYAYTSREDLYLEGLRLGKAAWDDRITYSHDFFDWMTPRYTLGNYSPFGLSTSMFVKTLELLASPEQQRKWLAPAREGRINGTYVQTELGHGSFVRGVETTATFDPSIDCFVLHSPTLTSTKFWPGSLAFSATHAIVMARLLTDGKDYGVHPFMLQIRDTETSKPVDGVDLGDVGLKPSHNQNDNGYARFEKVAIPRENLLGTYAAVTREGSYRQRAGLHPKLLYSTMLITRSKIVWVCGLQLAAAVTIAVRYSTVREQGNLPVAEKVPSHHVGEMAIIEYRSQHYRLLVWLAKAYAILFASKRCETENRDFELRQAGGDYSTLAHAHALTSGMKAWASAEASDGAEDARKMCGGAGYLAISGLPDLVASVTVVCTLEGENYVLLQQVARYLIQGERKRRREAAPQNELHILQGISYLEHERHSRCESTGKELLEPAAQLAIFRHRAQRLVAQAESGLERAAKTGKTISESWNDNMMQLISAARCHIEYLALQEYAKAVAGIRDARIKAVMTKLCSLFALSSITNPQSANSIFFVEDGYLTAEQLSDIRGLVGDLLTDLLPDIIGLTDAWDFTDGGLCSAIGMKDGNVYETMMSWIKQLPLNLQVSRSGGVHMHAWECFLKPAFRGHL
jgi:acyl-CoA oxidase